MKYLNNIIESSKIWIPAPSTLLRTSLAGMTTPDRKASDHTPGTSSWGQVG